MDRPHMIEALGKAEWYHQRFDGSPMYLSLIGEADTRPEKRMPSGVEARWLTCFYEKGKADGYLDMADINRGAEILLKMAKTSSEVSADLMEKWKADEERFEEYFAHFQAEKLSNLSDKELAEEFETFRTLAVNRLSSTCIIDHFALGTDQKLADLLRQETGITKESELNQAFSVATAPVHQSFINRAEIELLNIAARQEKGEDVTEALKEHQRRWFWMNNNYVRSQVLPVRHFQQEIEAWKESSQDLAAYAKELQEKPVANRVAKEELFKKYQLSAWLRNLLKISEDLTHWQDERKRATYLAIYIGSSILSEMGKRRGVEAELLKYLTPAEVSDWFLKAAPSVADLENRVKGCFVVWEDHKTTVFVGAEAWGIYEAINRQSGDTIGDIRGLVACTGKARGRARIVLSSEEMDKVKPGDILIAVMTRPDYVPAMRRAAAIVTNEGGITCHAAIVSRELGLPCIIGTKVATKVFKDGDLIEVNANHNWVRKVAE